MYAGKTKVAYMLPWCNFLNNDANNSDVSKKFIFMLAFGLVDNCRLMLPFVEFMKFNEI